MTERVEIVSGGRRYRWTGPGLGSQLESREWRLPLPGTERLIMGHRYYLHMAYPTRLRWRCTWGVSSSCDLQTHHARIEAARLAIVGVSR